MTGPAVPLTSGAANAMKPPSSFSTPRNPSFRIHPWVAAFALTLFLFLFYGPGLEAADVSLAWDDGGDPGTAGYKVYYGLSSRNYSAAVDVGKTTAHVVTGLQNDRRYYFAVTAYDANRRESGFSREVVWGMDSAAPVGRSARGGCLIASLAYNGQYAEEVMILSYFRDRYLLPHAPGRLIIRLYEWVSPTLAELVERHEALRLLTRWALSPLVYTVSHPRRAAAIAAGVVLVSAGCIVCLRRKRRNATPQGPG